MSLRSGWLPVLLGLALLAAGPVSTARTPTYRSAVLVCRFADPAICESSGLALSRRQDGVLWTHNDSGDQPRVYAVDRRGRTLATFTLRGAAAFDWEDMAIGPGPDAGGDYLYVGDVGDNGTVRPEVHVYRIPEPVVDADTTGAVADVDARHVERFRLRYPDGPHNCESLLVHPKTGAIYLATKEPAGMCYVYTCRVPRDGETHMLEKVADLKPPDGRPNTTGGDISPDGSSVVLCNYDTAWEFRARAERPFDELWRTEPLVISMPTPGEAIAYRADGNALLISSEGEHAPVYELRRDDGR